MSKKAKKRVRTDTFWLASDADNAEYFDKILEGVHPVYYLNQEADVNLDYRGTKRSCWRVLTKASDKPVSGLRSTETYRLSLLWSVLKADFWSDEKKQKLLAAIPTVATKRGKHSRHRCPNSWCCNPGHIQMGERAANEIDKHFHYFLNMESGVGIKFMDTFRRLCKKQRVWGKYPPSEQ